MNRIIHPNVWNSLSKEERESIIRYWEFIGIDILFLTSLTDDLAYFTSIKLVGNTVYISWDAYLDPKTFTSHTIEELKIISELMN